MSGADVLPSAPSGSFIHSTPFSNNLSACSQDVSFEATVPFVDQHVKHDIRDAKTIKIDLFLRGLGANEHEIARNDEDVRAIVMSHEVQELRRTYCQKMTNEVERYGPFCNLANHIIDRFEKPKIVFVRNDPRYIDGVYNSKRKPDVIAVPKDHKNVIEGRWKDYNKNGPPRKDEGGKRKDSGGGKKAEEPFVPWNWGHVCFVAEFKKSRDAILFDNLFSSALKSGADIDSGDPSSAGAPSITSKPLGSKVHSRIGSSESKGGTSSPRAVMQSFSSSTSGSRASGKRALQEEMDSEASSRKKQKLDVKEMRGDLEFCGVKYAVDQLSALTNRRHVIECLIIDGVLFMAYYDRIGPIYSTELNFVKDLYLFVLLLKRLASMSAWQRGFLRELKEVDAINSASCDDSSSSSLSEDNDDECDENDLGLVSSPLTQLSSESDDFSLVSSPLTELSGESEEQGIDQIGTGGGSKDDLSKKESLEERSEIGPPPTPPIESQQLAEVTTSDGDDEDVETELKEKTSDSMEQQGGGARVPISHHPDDLLLSQMGEDRYILRVKEHTVRLCNPCGRPPPYGLITRGSSVFTSQCATLGPSGAVYAAKISWPLKRRRAEDSILKAGRRALRKLDADPELKKKYGNRKFEDSLPVVYLAEEIDNLKEEHSFRWRIMRRDLEFLREFNKVNRVCRVLIMEFLMPLSAVASIDQFKQAMRDLVLVHHLLFFSEKRILHRDVSVNNLMVRHYNDGSICGVLIDFDLAEVRSAPTQEPTGSRSGTRPFMAWELLESNPPPIHLERYDWESFFYVISWIGCRFSEGKEVDKTVFSDWFDTRNITLAGLKRGWLYGPDIMRWFTKFYEDVASNWIYHMQVLFKAGNDALSNFMVRQRSAKPGDPILDEKFDKNTFGGHITWDKLWKILQN